MYTLLLTFFVIAILFSFLCSMWEAVLLSVTPAYAHSQMQRGSRIGRDLQQFKQNIDRPLAAILTLNTIAHTVGAIGVGNQATLIWHDANPLITGLAVPAGMTLAILVLSEIVPKTLGANYWKELAPFTVNALKLIITILAPLVWLSEKITRFLKKDKGASVFSRRDFLALAEIGADEGVIEHHESRIIRNLMRFEKLRARDAMTPRTVILTAEADSSIAEFHEQHPKLPFSRIPLTAGDIDQVTGYALKNAIFAALLAEEGDQPLHSLQREMIVVNQDDRIPDVFDRLLEKREHIALVVDDYGGTAGLITLEDVIETLLGLEIIDESDPVADMQQLARRHWESRARAHGLLEEAAGAPGGETPDSCGR